MTYAKEIITLTYYHIKSKTVTYNKATTETKIEKGATEVTYKLFKI